MTFFEGSESTLPELIESIKVQIMQTWLIFLKTTYQYKHFGVKFGFIRVPS